MFLVVNGPISLILYIYDQIRFDIGLFEIIDVSIMCLSRYWKSQNQLIKLINVEVTNINNMSNWILLLGFN